MRVYNFINLNPQYSKLEKKEKKTPSPNQFQDLSLIMSTRKGY